MHEARESFLREAIPRHSSDFLAGQGRFHKGRSALTFSQHIADFTSPRLPRLRDDVSPTRSPTKSAAVPKNYTRGSLGRAERITGLATVPNRLATLSQALPRTNAIIFAPTSQSPRHLKPMRPSKETSGSPIVSLNSTLKFHSGRLDRLAAWEQRAPQQQQQRSGRERRPTYRFQGWDAHERDRERFKSVRRQTWREL